MTNNSYPNFTVQTYSKVNTNNGGALELHFNILVQNVTATAWNSTSGNGLWALVGFTDSMNMVNDSIITKVNATRNSTADTFEYKDYYMMNGVRMSDTLQNLTQNTNMTYTTYYTNGSVTQMSVNWHFFRLYNTNDTKDVMITDG